MINNFIDLSKFLLLLFGAKNTSNIFYSRILYLIDNKKLKDKEINQLLNGCMVEAKKLIMVKISEYLKIIITIK